MKGRSEGESYKELHPTGVKVPFIRPDDMLSRVLSSGTGRGMANLGSWQVPKPYGR